MSESQSNSMQILVKGLEGKTQIFDVTKKTTIAEIKEKIKNATCIPIEDIRLIYATKELTNQNDKSLEDLNITNHSTIHLVFRLKGGIRIKINVNIYEAQPIKIEIETTDFISNLKKAIYEKNQQLDTHQMNLYFTGIKMENLKKIEEYKINENDTIIQKKGNLTRNEGFLISYEPDFISEDDDPNEARAKMNCGHVISTESMTQFLRSLLKERKLKIECPGYDKNGNSCGGIWEFAVCKKIGVLSQTEIEEFEDGFAKIYMSQILKYQECPKCKSFIEKPIEIPHNRVYCLFCKLKCKQSQDFCWICLKPWITQNTTKCGNENCVISNDIIEILSSCRTIKINDVNDVPAIRACPNCKTLIEHKSDCKHIQCNSCKVNFCFICLKMKVNNEWQCGTYKDVCTVAERQMNF